MEFNVKQGSLSVFEKKVNLCDNKQKHDMIKSNLIIFGIPLRCPIIKAKTHCYDGSKIAMKFSAASQRLFTMFLQSNTKEVNIKLNITHDTGNSCFEAEHSMTKKKN
jgi:hypothetical protein